MDEGIAELKREAFARRCARALALPVMVVCFAGAGGKTDSTSPVVRDAQKAILASNWLDPRWEYRKKFTVAGANLAERESHDDVSLLLNLDSSFASVFVRAKMDGSDLVITGNDGTTPLSREIVSWNRDEQQSEIWFHAPRISRAEREFYLYYGNPDTTLNVQERSTWSPSYLGVYHFDDDPGNGVLRDHGPKANDVMAGNASFFTSGDTIAGAVGQAWHFNGSTHWIDADAIQSADSSFTISAWFASWNLTNSADFAFSVGSTFWHLSAKRNSTQQRPDFVGPTGYFTWTPSTLPDTLLHHLTWAMDGVADTIRFYYDGEEQDVFVRGGGVLPVYSGLPIEGNVGMAGPLFGDGNRLDLMEGIVDEFRVQTAVLSPQRVKLEYRNMSDPAAFYVLGPEETQTTPVSLLGVSGERFPDYAVLRWEVAGGHDEVRSFEVFRGSQSGPEELVSPAPLPGGSMEYSFLDEEVPEGVVRYWIAATLWNGSIFWHGPIQLEIAHGAPDGLFVHSAPNPFRENTTIHFRLPQARPYRLGIFDARGRAVMPPWRGVGSRQEQRILWNGRDDAGRLLPSGIYYYKLEAGRDVYTGKLLIKR